MVVLEFLELLTVFLVLVILLGLLLIRRERKKEGIEYGYE